MQGIELSAPWRPVNRCHRLCLPAQSSAFSQASYADHLGRLVLHWGLFTSKPERNVLMNEGWSFVLVYSGCYYKVPVTEWLKWQKSIFHSSQGWEVWDQGASPFSSCWELFSCLTYGCLPDVSPHDGKRGLALWSLLIRHYSRHKDSTLRISLNLQIPSHCRWLGPRHFPRVVRETHIQSRKPLQGEPTFQTGILSWFTCTRSLQLTLPQTINSDWTKYFVSVSFSVVQLTIVPCSLVLRKHIGFKKYRLVLYI